MLHITAKLKLIDDVFFIFFFLYYVYNFSIIRVYDINVFKVI